MTAPVWVECFDGVHYRVAYDFTRMTPGLTYTVHVPGQHQPIPVPHVYLRVGKELHVYGPNWNMINLAQQLSRR